MLCTVSLDPATLSELPPAVRADVERQMRLWEGSRKQPGGVSPSPQKPRRGGAFSSNRRRWFVLRRDTLEARFSDLTMTFALLLWTLDFGALCWAYYDIRHHATPSDMQGNGEWTPFLRVPTLRSREDRAQDGDSLYRTLVRGFAAAFYTLYFFIGVLAMHTLLSHMYRSRNPYLATLLVLQCVFAVFASLDDLTHIGSPWGIQECSKWASG